MKSVAIRDLRQSWPRVERELEKEGELLVTRKGRPVARLLAIEVTEKRHRPRFSAKENRQWRERVFGKKSMRIVDQAIAEDRGDGFA